MATIVGTSGNDRIRTALAGGSNNGLPDASPGGNDLVYAGDGADTIEPSAGFNIVFGQQGDDLIVLTAMASNVGYGFGDDGNDTISVIGGTGSQLDGGHGNDSLIAGDGYDRIDGGSGNDTIDGGNGGSAIRGDLGSDSITGGSGVDIIESGDGDNTVLGGGASDRLFGGFGNDSIVGGGNDTTDGNDYIDALGGNNTVLGGGGEDVIIATFGNDSLNGEDGNDRLEAGEGNNTLLGGIGNDSIFAAGGADSIVGGDGNDSLHAGFGNNTVTGDAGNDYIIAGGGNDSLTGGTGNDSIISAFGADTLHGEDGNDYMDSGDSNDFLVVGLGNDTAFAGGGNDTVLGNVGNDRLDGGDGTDNLDFSALFGLTVTITNVAGQQRVILRDGSNLVVGVNTHANFENFIGTGSHDRLTGGGWDETFTGSAGNDTIDGGTGFDVVRYDFGAPGNVVVNLLTGIAQDGLGGVDRIRKGNATDSFIEEVVSGGGNDALTGDSDSNWLRGGAGADTLDGGDGTGDYANWSGDADANGDGFGVIANLAGSTFGGVAGGSALDASGSTDLLLNIERLSGTAFRDVLIAGATGGTYRGRQGADTINGGDGYDNVSHRSDTDANSDSFGAIVNLSDTAIVLAGWGIETFTAPGLTIAVSTARDAWGDVDQLTAIEGANGTFVNDLLIGRNREPTIVLNGVEFHATERSFLHGMLGADTIRGIEANDGTVADHIDDASGATIRLDLNYAIDGWGFVDTLVNVRNARGSNSDDLIVAGTSGSWMRGLAGNDTLAGGAGFDFVSHGGATAGVLADLALGTAQDGLGWTDQLTSIDGLSGGFFADTLIGNAGDNMFFGSRGADRIDGAGGEDIVSYYAAWQGVVPVNVAGVSVNLQGGIARDGDGSPLGGSLDRLTSIEHAVGSHLADTILGSSGANSIHGAEGDNSLSGGGGNDTLLGGAGNDTLDGSGGLDNTDGGAGNDLHLVNNRFDLVIEADGGGADTISATTSYSLAATVFVETLVATGGAALELSGNPFANTLIGNSGANRLDGSAGADDLYGLGGADTLIGGTGKDTLTGHDDADYFFYGRGSESFRANVDWITDFESGVDKLAFASAGNALFAGLTPTAISFNGSVAVINAALGAGAETYAEVMSGLNAGLGGSGNVTASGATLQVWQVEVAGGSAAGSYLFVNDGIAGAATATDMLIAFTLAGGPIVGSDFILV